MTVLPMEGLRGSPIVRDLDAQAAVMAAAPDRLVIRCPIARSVHAEGRLAELDDTLVLDAAISDVDGWEVQEAIVHAVRTLGVSNVLVWGHSDSDHAKSSSRAAQPGAEKGDFMARMVGRLAHHRESLVAAKQAVREAVAGLETLVGEHAAIHGAVEIAQSGCLLFYDREEDDFEAIE